MKLQLLSNLILVTSSLAVDKCSILKKFGGDPVFGKFGICAESLGDINFDGEYDYIVGANYYSGVGDQSGKVYIISGLDGSSIFTFDGEAAEDEFGFRVASAGDINNDGINDFLIGAPFYDGPNLRSGRVYVFSGATGDTLFVKSGSNFIGDFGFSLASLGDLNEDGHDDFIIGEPLYDSIPGRAYVFSGLDGDTLFVFVGDEDFDRFGWFVANAGDVDNDGFNDVIIGAPSWIPNPVLPGKAFVYSGRTGNELYTFTGEFVKDNFGISVGGAGDVNSDGYDDLVIGAYGYPNGGTIGRVYVFSGFDGDTLFIIDSPMENMHFGFRVSGTGDVDNDGFDDFMVGAYFHEATGIFGAGKVYIYSGLDGRLLKVFSGEATFSYFGIWVAPAGDFNGDGFDDILVGAHWDGESEYYAGSVYILSIVDCFFNRGDVNHDGVDATVEDLTYMVERMFRGGGVPDCPEEADVNSDGVTVNILDLTFLVDYIFRGGTAPGACY